MESFKSYIDISLKVKNCTVFINNGMVKPQIAYKISLYQFHEIFLNMNMRRILPKGSKMIVIDSKKHERKYNQMIAEYYTLIEEQFLLLYDNQIFPFKKSWSRV